MARAIGVGEAILGGSALIALGLFFGLRARPPGPSATIAPTLLVDRDGAVREALEARRARFVDQCWTPSAARDAAPATSTYVFEIAIDAAGRERGRGISDVHGARSDVGQCLRALGDQVQVAGPVAPGVAHVEMTLP
jgi:hypothetical protein